MRSASWASSPARFRLGVLVTLMLRSSFRRSLLYWSLRGEESLRLSPKPCPKLLGSAPRKKALSGQGRPIL